MSSILLPFNVHRLQPHWQKCKITIARPSKLQFQYYFKLFAPQNVEAGLTRPTLSHYILATLINIVKMRAGLLSVFLFGFSAQQLIRICVGDCTRIKTLALYFGSLKY